MFYPLSKIITALTLPSNLAALTILAGVMLITRANARPETKRLGRHLALTGLALLCLLGIVPAGNMLIYPLEQRAASFPAARPGDRFAGIIILGGFEDGWVSTTRPGLAINEAAERLTEGLRLARAHPDAKVVFTGGSGAFLREGANAATPVARWLGDVGIGPERIVLEDKSRNTHENAVLTRGILKPKPGERWLLVSSAFHMPRAVGVFRKAGFDVTAHPVDFRTRDAGDMLRPFESYPDGLKRVDMAAREWVGLLVYRLTGRSDALWPGPVAP